MSEQVNIFEWAVRNNATVASPKGELLPQQLFQLPLESLNTLAKGVSRQLKAEGEEDFIGAGSKVSKDLQNKLELLKAVIADKKAKKAAADVRAENRANAELLERLVAEKTVTELASNNLDTLKDMLAKAKAAS